jgi:hypothetical protein
MFDGMAGGTPVTSTVEKCFLANLPSMFDNCAAISAG